MQLRTFLAKDMKSAFSDVRTAMGNEAVIVSSEKAKGGGVLVRAALDGACAPEETPVPNEGALSEPDESEMPVSLDAHYRDSLIRRLRDTPGAKLSRRRFDRSELLAIFARHRLPESLAHMLAEESAKTNLNDMTLALAAAIDARMTARPIDFETAQAFLLLGPNGAGKTSIAAKLAAHARLAGREVTLIAGDATGAGAVARLAAFAEHLGAEVVVANCAAELTDHTESVLAKNALAIIDTAGFDPRQPKAAAAFAALTRICSLQTIGVVSALTDSEEISEIADALAHIGASRLIVTSADLARRAGALTAAALTQAIGFAYVTRSPFVAGGLETLTSLALARLLVENERESAQ